MQKKKLRRKLFHFIHNLFRPEHGNHTTFNLASSTGSLREGFSSFWAGSGFGDRVGFESRLWNDWRGKWLELQSSPGDAGFW